MLRGHVFVAASDVPPDVRSLVVASGGRVVSSLDPSVTAGLVLRGGECQLNCSHHLRGLRIPVLRTSWVRASVAAGRLLPMKFPHVECDPMLLDGLRITTTLLPHDVKKRVAAVIQFCGGTYSPHLTNYTDILIHGDCGDITSNAERTMKWRCAWGRGVVCTPLGWLQDCIASGRRIDLPPSSPPPAVLPTSPPPPSLATSLMSPAAAATETATIKTETMWTQKNEEEDESSCGSSHEAAGKKKCDSSPSLPPGTKYQKGSHVDNTVHSGCNAGKAISLLPSKGEIWENLFKE